MQRVFLHALAEVISFGGIVTLEVGIVRPVLVTVEAAHDATRSDAGSMSTEAGTPMSAAVARSSAVLNSTEPLSRLPMAVREYPRCWARSPCVSPRLASPARTSAAVGSSGSVACIAMKLHAERVFASVIYPRVAKLLTKSCLLRAERAWGRFSP